MADIENILPTDSGKVAFEKTDRNMVKINNQSINKNIKTYTSLSQIGISSESYFEGKTATEAIDAIVVNMGRPGIFVSEFKGSGGLGTALANHTADANTAAVTFGDSIIVIDTYSTGRCQITISGRGRSWFATYENWNNPALRGWFEVGTSSTVTCPYMNNWVDAFSTSVTGATIRKVGNVLFMAFSVKSGVYDSGTTIIQTPSGYRPSGNSQIFPITVAHSGWKYDGNFTAQLRTDGQVSLVSTIPGNDRVVVNAACILA